jgi:hypothetical protein
MTKHKWHKEIKAWADGEQIQYRKIGSEKWHDEVEEFPYWETIAFEYRVKPQPKEPQYLYVFCDCKGNQLLRTHKGKNSHETYIGKIKLEVDDD